MKTILAMTSSVVGLVALLFVLNLAYWHLFGLHYRQHPSLPGALFWLGFLFTTFATSLAAWNVRQCWQRGEFLGPFVWCCTLCISYLSLLIYAAQHPLQ